MHCTIIGISLAVTRTACPSSICQSCHHITFGEVSLLKPKFGIRFLLVSIPYQDLVGSSIKGIVDQVSITFPIRSTRFHWWTFKQWLRESVSCAALLPLSFQALRWRKTLPCCLWRGDSSRPAHKQLSVRKRANIRMSVPRRRLHNLKPKRHGLDSGSIANVRAL